MMRPNHSTKRQTHLELDLELSFYNPEVVQAAQEARHLTTTYSDPLQLPAKAHQVWERRYSNIERVALGMLPRLEKFHHYCFAREVSIITDHKPQIVIFKKVVAMLSQRMQQILLRIYQYRVRKIYKPGPDQFITDWLSR